MTLRIIFLGDVCGEAGRRALNDGLFYLRHRYKPDFIVVNGENTAGGFGITPKIAEEIFLLGVDCITLGDHAFDRKEIMDYLESQSKLLRPLNFPLGTPGQGIKTFKKNGHKITVINLIGRVFMKAVDCPFRRVEEELQKLGNEKQVILVDFHAEATAEKRAMGWFLDERVTAILGTHTHIPTADEQILPKGSAYITDIGMCGAFNSVLGMKVEDSLKRLLYGISYRLHPAQSDIRLCGIFLEADPATGKALSISRFCEKI